MKYIKKYWFPILVIITLIRFSLSYNLPSFYISNLKYDDKLMINQFTSIISGNYLGDYNNYTLIKGFIFPIILSVFKFTKISYSVLFTFIYILSCIYFTLSLKGIIKNKKILILIYIILLFNPISYSSDLFQRLYRNTLSITQLLLFLGIVIRIIKKDKIINYILLGIILSIMYLTREDNIWTIVILIILTIYKLYKNKNIKLIYNVIPIIILIINLNIVSSINHKYYDIYTYNEITKSEFNKTYMKILKIKDDEKLDKVSITKSTLYKLSEMTNTFDFSKEEIDKYYKRLNDENGEFNNGNIIWYLRNMIYKKNKFKTGKESEEYYKKLGIEIDKLFKEKKLESELTIPSIFINMPTLNELKVFPKDIIKSIIYTTSYKNIRTITNLESYEYDTFSNAYKVIYGNYHYTENIVETNPLKYEIIRVIYKYFTIILSLVSIIIYIKNIKIKDKLNLIIHTILISYLIILLGVTYTNTTAFHSIRYFYLGNIYILQNLFIILNLGRFYEKKRKH